MSSCQSSELGDEDELAKHGGLFSVKKILFIMSAIMMDTCHYTCGQTRRMYNTKSKSSCKLWTLGDNDVSMWAHQL